MVFPSWGVGLKTDTRNIKDDSSLSRAEDRLDDIVMSISPPTVSAPMRLFLW